MEFVTEIAPYLRLRSNTGKNYLEFQHASMGAFRDEPPPLCSLSLSYITYDVYISYLKENDFGEEEYFEKIRKMSTVSSVKKIASKVKKKFHSTSEFIYYKKWLLDTGPNPEVNKLFNCLEQQIWKASK